MDDKKRSWRDWLPLTVVLFVLVYGGAYGVSAKKYGFIGLVYDLPGFPEFNKCRMSCGPYPDEIALCEVANRRDRWIRTFFWPAHELDRFLIRPRKWRKWNDP